MFYTLIYVNNCLIYSSIIFFFCIIIVVLIVFSIKFKLRKVFEIIFYIIRSLNSDNIGRLLISEWFANYQKDRQISTGFGQCKNDDLSDNWVFFLISELGPNYQKDYINDIFSSKFDGENGGDAQNPPSDDKLDEIKEIKDRKHKIKLKVMIEN